MACNQPLPAWRTKRPNDNGRFGVTFVYADADTSSKLEVPCGRCIGCRLEKAATWAARILHESKLHRFNYFVTLTYSDDKLHKTHKGLPTLYPEDFVLFMKRLRRRLEPETLRFYQCGEYGESTQRPHHHAILFNCHLPDLKPIHTTRARNAHTLYTSKLLADTWQNGHISVGQVNYETAAYVAAYVTKKITGPTAEQHYQGRIPEYSTMSRRPGIGRNFLEKFATDVYPADNIVVRGHTMRPPKYYDRILEKEDPELWYQVRDQRLNTPTHHPRHVERQARELTALRRQRKRDYK